MSILLPFAMAWAKKVNFVQEGEFWVRGNERITTDELIRRYQASIK
ncbi:MAG TPA: hypothetical protein PK999_16665 [Nitrospira sp.]|nr:hypothetical protein [Nitrospira sp.]